MPPLFGFYCASNILVASQYCLCPQVSGHLLVVELQRVLMEHELTCHRTCFSLQLGGNTLDGLTKLRDVQGLQVGASLKVVEGSRIPSAPLF